MTGSIHSLFTYPVKGLSAQPLETVSLKPGRGFPLDRAFGFARADSGFDPQNPRPLPKGKFVMLARDERLALLDTSYDAADQRLRIEHAGRTVVFDISTNAGRAEAAAFVAGHLEMPDDMRPRLYSAAPHRFTDVSVVSASLMNAVSLINLESVKELAAKIGQPVDPERFRGNILLSGAAAFSELDWLGREITIGEVRLKVVMRTKRCPATQVNLKTGTRDLDIPALIRTHYGHADMGIYCEVQNAATLSIGDRVALI